MVTRKMQLVQNRKEMRKTVILLLALTLVVTSIGAAAAKGKPSSPDPVYYEVTMDLVDGVDGVEGLATDATCGGDVPLNMRFEESRRGSYLVADGAESTSMPRLWLRADVAWARTEPHETSGPGFDGCHGGPLPGSESNIPSYFVVHRDRSGNMVSILWAFDVYTEEGTKRKNKTPGVKEYFRLWSTDEVSMKDASGNSCPLAPSEPVTCIVSGPFEVWHYYPIEQIGTADFDLTIAAHTP